MPRLHHGVVSRHGDDLGANHTSLPGSHRDRRREQTASFLDVLYRGRCTMARWIICKCVCVCVCVCALARWLPLFVFQLCVSLHISNLFQASSTCSKKPDTRAVIGPHRTQAKQNRRTSMRPTTTSPRHWHCRLPCATMDRTWTDVCWTVYRTNDKALH